MANWKSNLIEAYRFTSLPLRAWQMQQRRKAGQVPVFVVFYHRVSDINPNPWTMSCQDFENQILWFEKRFDIVNLEECQRRISSGHNKTPTLAITFDDGYAENSEFALPLLLERRIPLTYFVTVDNAVLQKPFPHDTQLGNPLPVNSIESLRAINISGIEIGAHTRNHTDLGQLTNSEELIDEVITSSRELADLIDCPIRYFAFPYGHRENLNPVAFQLLKSAGFLGACTTMGGWNQIGGDAFQLTRLHGDPSFARMKNWLSFDPRLACVKPFEYAKTPDRDLPSARPAAPFPSITVEQPNATLNQQP